MPACCRFEISTAIFLKKLLDKRRVIYYNADIHIQTYEAKIKPKGTPSESVGRWKPRGTSVGKWIAEGEVKCILQSIRDADLRYGRGV